MNIIVVKTQEDLNSLPDSFESFTVIEIRSAETISIKKLYGNSSAELYGNSSAELHYNSSAKLYDNSSAELYDNSSAELYDNSRTELYDTSRAGLYGNSSAELYDNSRAGLYGNSSAELYYNSSAVLKNNSSAKLYGNSRAELHYSSSARLYGNSRAELYDNSSAKLYDNSSAELFNESIAHTYSASSATAYENSVLFKHSDSSILEAFDSAKIQNVVKLNIPFDTWLERGYVVCDGIYQKYVSEEKHGDIVVYTTDKGYVARRGEVFAHGKKKHTAFADLRFKLSKRNTDEFKLWDREEKRNIEDLIYCYRAITGACSFGCESFIENNIEIEKQYSINEVIELTRDQYGHEKFKEFWD